MNDVYNELLDIGKRRGLLWPSFEIYGSAAGFFDYGPLGSKILDEITSLWRNYYIKKEGFEEINTTNIMSEPVFEGSGHLDGFDDSMTNCNDCNSSFRADHLIENFVDIQADSLSNEKIKQIIDGENINCPKCGGSLGEVYNFNLMFKTNIGPGSARAGYLRPETAQGIFVNFPYLYKYNRESLPFGVVQIGRAYRNEISPRQGVIRLREFLQMEAEVFVDPNKKIHPKFSELGDEEIALFDTEKQSKGENAVKIKIGEAVEKGIIDNEMLAYYIVLTKHFLINLGIDEDKLRFRQHMEDEMAHYASDCWDAEAKSERFGWVELVGVADRCSYDLEKHEEKSGMDMTAFREFDESKTEEKLIIEPKMDKIGPKFKEKAKDVVEKIEEKDSVEIKKEMEEDTIDLCIDGETIKLDGKYVNVSEEKEIMDGEKFYPHVIEPSYGLDRIFYITLEHSIEKDVQDGEERTYLKLPTNIAPIKVAVFPLLSKDRFKEEAERIYKTLSKKFETVYDDSGSIGRRYRRQDEVGTPYCITVDHKTLEDNTVTLRERDSTSQVRVNSKDLAEIIKELISKNRIGSSKKIADIGEKVR